MKHKHLNLVLTAALLSTAPATFATISITSTANGESQPVNMGTQPTIQIGGGFKVLNVSFTQEVDLINAKSHANISTGSFINVVQDALPNILTGDLPDPLPAPVLDLSFGATRLGYINGQADTLAQGIGTGPANNAKISANFSLTDTLTITVPEPTTLELPLHISGEAVAFAFGDPNDTYGSAVLSITGSLGTASVGTFQAVADSRLSIPLSQINESRVMSLDLDAGTHDIDFSISGTGSSESSAKGFGLFGIIMGSASSAVVFPNTIEVGIFTGLDGSALPVGTIIMGSEGIDYPLKAVPLPLSALLFASGVGVLGLFRRHRKAMA